MLLSVFIYDSFKKKSTLVSIPVYIGQYKDLLKAGKLST